ncbi:thioester reductase domain-containing protein [Photorhabdus namnaonensis]|uniref:Linear gramicidin synthase subunit D n=1 Tax=Photorhabdus namnaonensis TaxID=1851568 RepID=A0A1B8YHV0_9GAMM|nr:thioester reductase domain-containing protein [Photorhabdus namnaonensis]OCA54699.1 Linear gramicidin synthase subunit D [Photorhabdus namnaonensis]
MKEQNVLLTGATGFIGAYMLDELIKTRSYGKIFVIIRKVDSLNPIRRIEDAYKKFSIEYKYNLRDSSKVEIIEGDITKPNLGLAPEMWIYLSNEIDIIHHIAARVNHIKPYDTLKSANVDSVRDIVELSKIGKNKIVNFVSTLGSAVALDSNGEYVENFPDSKPLFSDMGYLLSKWEAEKILREHHNSGGKTNIFRLGYVSGHSKTGISLYKDNQFMLFIKSCIQMGYAPILNRTIHLTPIDKTVEFMNLPIFSKEGGHVFNLFNYKELIHWSEIINWLKSYGYRIEFLEFYEWQKKLLQDGENSPLYRLFSLYGVPEAHEKILRFGREIKKFHYEQTDKICIKETINFPMVKYDLLKTYIDYLIEQEFIPSPIIENHVAKCLVS